MSFVVREAPALGSIIYKDQSVVLGAALTIDQSSRSADFLGLLVLLKYNIRFVKIFELQL